MSVRHELGSCRSIAVGRGRADTRSQGLWLARVEDDFDLHGAFWMDRHDGGRSGRWLDELFRHEAREATKKSGFNLLAWCFQGKTALPDEDNTGVGATRAASVRSGDTSAGLRRVIVVKQPDWGTSPNL